jgi:hypothetical protein
MGLRIEEHPPRLESANESRAGQVVVNADGTVAYSHGPHSQLIDNVSFCPALAQWFGRRLSQKRETRKDSIAPGLS